LKPKAPLRQVLITVGLMLLVVIVALALTVWAPQVDSEAGEVLPATPVPAQVIPIPIF
jgi:hypothetical protein